MEIEETSIIDESPKTVIENIMKEKHIKGKVIMAMVAGSYCYNLNKEGSDKDYMAVIDEEKKKEIKGRPRKLKIYQHKPHEEIDYSIYEWKRFENDIKKGMPFAIQIAFAYPFKDIKKRETLIYESNEWKIYRNTLLGAITTRYKQIDWKDTTIALPYKIKHILIDEHKEEQQKRADEKHKLMKTKQRFEVIRKAFREGAKRVPTLELLKDPPVVGDKHCKNGKKDSTLFKAWNSKTSLNFSINYVEKEMRRYEGFVEKNYPGKDLSKFIYHSCRYLFEMERQTMGEYPLIYYPNESIEREVLMMIRCYDPPTIYHEDKKIRKLISIIHQQLGSMKLILKKWKKIEKVE
mmetsp:Transcript_205/g.357  ORF Transcript_205/g.357 Transcript_205/m.357 type:complete len:349 (+) Transcript_205:86-1132(+)